MNRNLEYLQRKVAEHEDRANYYYKLVRAMEDKQRLIGFRMKNDDRLSTDGVALISSRITTEERYF